MYKLTFFCAQKTVVSQSSSLAPAALSAGGKIVWAVITFFFFSWKLVSKIKIHGFLSVLLVAVSLKDFEKEKVSLIPFFLIEPLLKLKYSIKLLSLFYYHLYSPDVY